MTSDGDTGTDKPSVDVEREAGDAVLDAKVARVYRYVRQCSSFPDCMRFGGRAEELTAVSLHTYSRLDWRIIPALWVLYFLCAAIRSNVGLSLTMNTATGNSLTQKLALTNKQTSTGVALFYVCYVVFDAPANLVMTKVRPHVWMSRIVVGVGIIGACHAALTGAWNF